MSEFLSPLSMSFAVLVLCCSCYAFVLWTRKKRRARELATLRDAWGKRVERARDFSLYPSSLKARCDVDENQCLDDDTWRDLNLDLVFAHLDRTSTLPGEIELYRAMRASETTTDVLEKRDDVISLFQTDVATRESVQLQLSRLGRTYFPQGILDLLWGELPQRSPFTPLYRLLAMLVLLAVAASVLLLVNGLPYGAFAFCSIGALYTINFSIHYWTRSVLEERIRSIRYLSKMIATGHHLSQPNTLGRDSTGLEECKQRLKRHAMAVKAIPRATAVLVPERGGAFDIVDLVQEHVSILFLIEVRGFYAVLDQLRIHRAELQGLFCALGELDALQAMASFRDGLETYCKPEFATDRRLLEVDGAYHPLLESPVPNSITITDRGCLVTGSNMSGKSTFLRTMGVCAVLAQSTFTCPAAAYRGSMLQIASSLSPMDDLMDGKSFYLVEAERLLTMIHSSQGSRPALLIIDEMLRGTNSTERLAASEAILSFLVKNNAVIIVATHDVELVQRLAASYDSFHFSDQVDSSGLQFDYNLRPGRATTTNAIRLLDHLSYPSEIVENARRQAFGPHDGESRED